VLLVEDVEINQEIARTFLEAEGHRVDVAADGPGGGARRAPRAGYDLVLHGRADARDGRHHGDPAHPQPGGGGRPDPR
jgi:hypothetical protein